MDLTGLVTFWALVLAAIAVLPEYWRFRIKAFIGPTLGITLTVLALVVSTLLLSLAMFTTDGELKAYLEILAYLVLVAYSVYLAVRLFTGRVTRQNLDRFCDLLSSLSASRQHETMASAIRDNTGHLHAIGKHEERHRWQKHSDLKHDRALTRLVDQIASDHEFNRFLVRYDISIPLALVGTCEEIVPAATDYLDTLLTLLMSDTDSPLHSEIRRHQNLGKGWRRDMSDSELLKSLFADAELCKKRAIWQPVGEFVRRFIHDRPGGPADSYNHEAVYYTDPSTSDRFSDPVFVGLEFFDFMVKEALLQKVEWHMWLYYFHHWTREIMAKAKYDPNEWSRGYWEFPTRYAYLLYHMIDYQLRWFECSWDNDLSIELDTGNTNSNILQSASKCLAFCLREICQSEDRVSDQFKRSLLTLWWNWYFELQIRRGTVYPQYADFLLKSLIEELNLGRAGQEAYSLLGSLVSGLTHVDEIKEWVDADAYRGRMADMKELLQHHVVPLLLPADPLRRGRILQEVLGTHFKAEGDGIWVTNRHGPNQYTKVAALG